jgi:hypothetical protein
MVSDSLIAINKFVTPVALSSLWILATYYCAQLLIVHNVGKANCSVASTNYRWQELVAANILSPRDKSVN